MHLVLWRLDAPEKEDTRRVRREQRVGGWLSTHFEGKGREVGLGRSWREEGGQH